MLDYTDIATAAATTPRNRLRITGANEQARAEADFTALRLIDLQTSPIRGGFDAAHLQAIHHHVYQDIYEWAGELRQAYTAEDRVAETMNQILDRLSRDNHLKGLDEKSWSEAAASYLHQLSAVRPFLAGNELTLREFGRELALKNGMALDWAATRDATAEIARELLNGEQAATLRRIIMLSVDSESTGGKHSRGTVIERGAELVLIGINPLL